MIEMIMNGTTSETNNPYIGASKTKAQANRISKDKRNKTLGFSETNSAKKLKESSTER